MRSPAMHDKILIVDFGSQVTQLIARRVREEGVYCEIVPFQKAAEAFAAMKPKGVILSGGPASVLDDGRAARAAWRSSRRACRCSASATASRRWRRSSAARSRAGITASSAAPRSRSPTTRALFEGVWQKGERYPVWMSHGDRVTELPAGLPRGRHLAERADRDDRRREAQILRHAVPSRSRAHAARRGAAAQFRAQDRRRAAATGPCAPSRTRRSRRSARRSARAG